MTPAELEGTILSQYANSPTITGLIQYMYQWFRPDADLDNFYNFVWNVSTAQGFGLEIWGRIVGLGQNPRTILSSPPVTLNDDQLRSLILLKALSNISAATAPAINQLLRNWMTGRGRCYVNDLGNMELKFQFEFPLEPFEVTIITTLGIFLRPAGVGAIMVDFAFPVFGFNEMGTTWIAPFNQAPMLSESEIYAVK